MFFSKQVPFRTNTPSSNTFNSCFKKGGRCDQMSFEWNPLRSSKPYLLQLCPLDSFLSMNPFPYQTCFGFQGFDLSELYTELLCNSSCISVFTICSPFSNADMCYCLSTMCHQFTTTNSVKWKSGQGEIYFRLFCSTSFYSLPHANHRNSELGSKK